MFTAKWKKQAKELAKGARKFVDYKRDLLKPERVAEIESRRADLLAAAKSGDRARADEASKQLRATCENALPHEKPLGWLEENVEVMFVAIVIALGLRAYYLQPFRIPTGSMQPTLNGIIGTPTPEAEWPGLPKRLVEKVLRGRTYVHVVADKDLKLAVSPRGALELRDIQYLHFFSRSEIGLADSKPFRLPAPLTQAKEIGLDKAIDIARYHKGVIPAGTTICEGTIDSGDLVLVDKFSYHFRKPKRGEVFVFDTIGIEGTKKNPGVKRTTINDQENATHYIKRLGAVPGDTLSISPPHVLIDGEIARETGFEKVYQLPTFHQPGRNGYSLASPGGSPYPPVLSKPGDKMLLSARAAPGMREYAALGDNSGNSLDSRYWGPVKEFNLVGPALFSLWPVSTGHWGFIR